jgi:hypothetical protein
LANGADDGNAGEENDNQCDGGGEDETNDREGSESEPDVGTETPPKKLKSKDVRVQIDPGNAERKMRIRMETSREQETGKAGAEAKRRR